MRRVYVATKNAGKLRELREIFAGSGLVLETYDGYADVVEGETSYTENAALKARALRAQLRAAGETGAVLGDDSGLEVAALNGRPGVLSARYGGPSMTWAERRRTLIAETDAAGTADRSARFVCALHFVAEDGAETAVCADVAGRLAREERGDGGFSYDAVFELAEHGATFAELSEEEKNRISHRAKAAELLLREIVSGSRPPAA